jgi:hypothetical protein
MKVELALALRDDAHDAIVTRLTWDEESQGEYTGPVTNRQYRLFRYMQDFTQRQKLFRKPTLNGRVWTLWSVMFDDEINVLQLIQDEIDQLAADYPSQVVVAGAFHWEGNQVGTTLVSTDPPTQTGTPTYPLHPQLIEFMPDTDDQGTRPTELSDTNLLFGQAPRIFA